MISKSDIQPEDGAVELFLDTVREQEASNQLGQGDGSEFTFRARGSVHEVMQISVLNGDGLPELDRRIRQMLGNVQKVLRAYEELHGIGAPEDDGWRSSVKREKAVLQVGQGSGEGTRSSVKEVRGMGVQDPSLLVRYDSEQFEGYEGSSFESSELDEDAVLKEMMEDKQKTLRGVKTPPPPLKN